MKIINTNENDFYMHYEYEIFTQKKPAILLFSAPWCIPCQQLHGLLEKINIEEPIHILTIDISEQPDSCNLLKEYNVSTVPHIIFIKNGELDSEVKGMMSESDLENKINFLLQKD